jgi:post-segregation antitoxin (ccd killing protein)
MKSMPTISIYISKELYNKLQTHSISDSRVVQIALEKYFKEENI